MIILKGKDRHVLALLTGLLRLPITTWISRPVARWLLPFSPDTSTSLVIISKLVLLLAPKMPLNKLSSAKAAHPPSS